VIATVCAVVLVLELELPPPPPHAASAAAAISADERSVHLNKRLIAFPPV
jgi:hypothetical protein